VGEIDLLAEVEVLGLGVGRLAGTFPATDQPGDRHQLGVQPFGHLERHDPQPFVRVPDTRTSRVIKATSINSPIASHPDHQQDGEHERSRHAGV
jgi:hypothetical protein